VADDILLETTAEPHGEIKARDLRQESPPQPHPEPEPEPQLEPELDADVEPEPEADLEPEPDTSELEPVAAQPPLEGVTPSSEWSWDEPEDYSAPV
jgi:hypothetical protein